MQGFLDIYMVRSKAFNEADLLQLEKLFDDTLAVAVKIYDDNVFLPWSIAEHKWGDRPHIAFADAVMVGICRNLNQKDRLVERRERIVDATKELFESHEDGTFTGRGNTKADVEERINLFDEMLRAVASA